MLILTRRTQESVRIGDDITVTVLGMKGDQVRIGINAPRQIPVHREEIYQRIVSERSATNAARRKALLQGEPPLQPAEEGA